MKAEIRTINAMAMTGVTDLIIGLIMFATGWHEWYFNHFHFFGIMGFSSLAYAFWHYYFLTDVEDKK